MSSKQNSNPLSLWAAGFVVVTAVLALAIERFRDVTFGRALVTAAILVAGIAVLTLAIIGIRRERSSRKRGRNVENDEADSSSTNDPQPPDSESAEREEPVNDPTTVDTDETVTDTPAIRQTPSAVQPDPQLPAPDVPESIADLVEYWSKLHPWSYYRHVVTSSFVLVLGLVVVLTLSVVKGPLTDIFIQASWLLPMLWLLWILSIGFNTVMLLRRRKIWDLRPLACDPRTGILTIYETGSRSWFIDNSPPDQYPLSEVAINTPRQTFFEQYVIRRSSTLVLEEEGKAPRVIRYVVDVDRIKAIAAAYRSLPTQQRDSLRQIAGLLGQQNTLLQQILRAVSDKS